MQYLQSHLPRFGRPCNDGLTPPGLCCIRTRWGSRPTSPPRGIPGGGVPRTAVRADEEQAGRTHSHLSRRQKQRGRPAAKPKTRAANGPTKQQRTQASSEEAGRSNGMLTPTPIPDASPEETLAELSADDPAALGTLPARRQAFVLAYTGAAGFNGALAARMAGYSEKTARSIASELLTFPDVRTAVEARLTTLAMSADEVLARLSQQARADISPYLYNRGDRLLLDLDGLKAAGLGHLIKEIWETDDGLRVKIHDAQAALVQLGRYHKLFTDQVDLKSGGKPIVVSNVQAVEPPGGDVPDDGSDDPS